jgi:hypothetical protein
VTFTAARSTLATQAGSTLVARELRCKLLEPDVAAAFPTADAVNRALREHLREHPSKPGG